jgi:hypothetical protein
LIGPAHYHPTWTATRPRSANADLRIITANGGHHSALKRAAESSHAAARPHSAAPVAKQVSSLAKLCACNVRKRELLDSVAYLA